MVAACIKAETGVGPSMASGSQIWSGNCADFPMAPINRPTPARVRVVPVSIPLATPSNMWLKVKEPIPVYINIIPIKNPISPTRLVRNAFLAASAAESFSNQCPISR